MKMGRKRNLHVCDICRRPRSKEFHRRYPAGRDYPHTHSVCRRCLRVQQDTRHKPYKKPTTPARQGQAPAQRIIHAINTTFYVGRNLFRALASREGLNIHLHHHHWHHGGELGEDPTQARDQLVETNDGRVDELKSRTMAMEGGGVAANKSSAQILVELPDGPAPAPSEVPGSYLSNENPPPIQPKPVFQLKISEYVD
ncbi:hypothetical protein NM208_g6468 [Fusarium decemcellulare]|uniref:Uncharacterized protein n=1 Tax=Fusarium decemcellulare TaxID=57161 RepID=A0ACC1SCZ2_9HYPO|nr:hypothetical protein NM208_g6468 [Fusarium decemcellulare]